MRKFLPALFVALAGALVLTGCDIHVGPNAAVVNGVVIPQQALNASLAAAAGDSGYICSITNAHSSGLEVAGAGTGSYSVEFQDTVLQWLVLGHLAADEAARQHVTSPASLNTVAQLQLGLGSQVQGCSGTPAAVLAKLAPEYRSALVSVYRNLDSLAAAKVGLSFTTSGLAKFAAANPVDNQVDCLSYLQVASVAAARSAIAAVNKGTPFAEEAQKVTEATQGTTVPCTLLPALGLPTQVNDAIAALQVGQITAPESVQGVGVLVFQLSARQPASDQDLMVALVNELQSDGALAAAGAEVQASGSVQLDPAYGSAWCKSSGASAILPPASPAAKFLPSPDAIYAQPPTSSTPAPACKGS